MNKKKQMKIYKHRFEPSNLRPRHIYINVWGWGLESASSFILIRVGLLLWVYPFMVKLSFSKTLTHKRGSILRKNVNFKNDKQWKERRNKTKHITNYKQKYCTFGERGGERDFWAIQDFLNRRFNFLPKHNSVQIKRILKNPGGRNTST